MNVVDSMFSDSASRVEGYRKTASVPAGPRGGSGFGSGSSSLLSNPYAGIESSSHYSGNEAVALSQYRASKKDNPYIAIRPIAMRVAALPIRIGTKKTKVVRPGGMMAKGYVVNPQASGGGVTSRPITARQKFLMPEMFKDLAEGIDIQTDHPLELVLENPNERMTKFGLMLSTVWSIQATGWGIWWLESGGAGSVAGSGAIEKIWYLPRHWVTPIHTKEKAFAGWLLKPPGVEGEGVTLDDDDVVAFQMPDPADPNGVLSPLQSQARSVVTDDAIQEAQAAGMRNFTKPGLMVVMGRMDAPTGQSPTRPILNASQRKEIADVIRLGYMGAVKNGEPIILDGLIENVLPYLPGVAEMDFPGSSELTRDRIQRGFGVNPVVTGATENSNRATAFVATEAFCDNVLNPIGSLISEALTAKVGKRYAGAGQKVYIWLEKAVPRDDELDNSRVQIMMDAEAITKNEIREKFGMEPLAGKDGDALVTRPQKPEPGANGAGASGKVKPSGDVLASGGGKSKPSKPAKVAAGGGRGDGSKIGKSIDLPPAGHVHSSRRHRRRL